VHGKHEVAGSNPAPGSSPTLALMASAYLEIAEGPGAGQVHPVEGTVTIGRGHGADLVLSDRAVSRQHAAVSLEGVTLVVEDLDSSNGTWVNGDRIEDPRRLGTGDLIRVGDSELRVRIETREEEVRTPTEPTLIEHEVDGG
jgi:pSer/pThr/pTyr-binding forkhead associated (FHA) protein